MIGLNDSDQFNKTFPDLPWNYKRATEQEEEVLNVSKIKETQNNIFI